MIQTLKITTRLETNRATPAENPVLLTCGLTSYLAAVMYTYLLLFIYFLNN